MNQSEDMTPEHEATLTGVRDLDAVRGRTGLRRLRIVASELPDLDALEELTGLTHLELVACRVGDPRGFLGVERVDLVCTVIEAVPVELYCWPRGHVVGLPHPADGRDLPPTAVPDGDTMTEHERREAVLSWERDGLLPGGGGLLVRPGLGADVDADLLLARRRTDDERELRRWLAGATGDLFDADTEASIGHFAQRFPHVLRLPVEVPGEPFRAVVPEANWRIEQHLSLWTLLRDCPAVRAGSATWAIGVRAPDPLDLLAAHGLLVVGRAVDGSGRLLVIIASGDSLFRVYGTTAATLVSALADRRDLDDDTEDAEDRDLERLAELAGPRTAAALTPVFASFGAFLDGVESLHPEFDKPETSETSAESLLHDAVRRQLKRLRAEARPVRRRAEVVTPAGPREVPAAVRELMAYDWPTGWSARLEDPQWAVRWCHIDIEPGILRESRAWLGVALVEEGQYYWVVDLDDGHPEDPQVYRVDHDDWDHTPYSSRLSDMLAELSLVEE